MYEVRFVGTPGHFGPFRDQPTARYWAKQESNGKAFNLLPVTPTS